MKTARSAFTSLGDIGTFSNHGLKQKDGLRGTPYFSKVLVCTCKCNRTKRSAKYRILYHSSFPKTLFPSFIHHLCLQFLYPTNFLVRECFSLLVSSIFYYHFLYLQVPSPPPPPPASITFTSRLLLTVVNSDGTL